MVGINSNVWLIFLNLICVQSVVHSAMTTDGQDDGEFYMGAIVKFNITNKITGKSVEQVKYIISETRVMLIVG